jgi:hypothetical protein
VEWLAEQSRIRYGHEETYTVMTGSGGRHLYYVAPDFTVPNSAGKIAPGVDVRGDGGMVVAPPSVSAKGTYRPHPARRQTAAAMPYWLAELVKPKPVPAPTTAPRPAGTPLPTREERYLTAALEGEIRRLDVMASQRTIDPRDYVGEPWNATCYAVACNLIEIANAGLIEKENAWSRFLQNAPKDGNFGALELANIWASALGKVGGKAKDIPPPDPLLTNPLTGHIAAMNADAATLAAASAPVDAAAGLQRLDVGNPALMADWLRAELGRGQLSGMFLRGKDEIVYVPQLGEQGYKPLTEQTNNTDGPAQVRAATADVISSQVFFNYNTIKVCKDENDHKFDSRALFPKVAAITVVSAPELMYNLDPLNGVVHSPTVRADGSVLHAVGYDHATGLLHLPTPGLHVPDVPESPTGEEVAKARDLIAYMLQDFSFETPVDKANYIGLMLTPLLRNVTPAPYKMALIEAHQPASGKTMLARALMTLHGGVFRSEMPSDDPELAKVITSILDVTTGPIVVFDNATGIIRSSILAGLLTSGQWQERRLGSSTMVSAQNDRIWTITGNNVAISGDLARRTLRVQIDPGMPHPELRTDFAIDDFEGWVARERGNILHALLVLIRNWFNIGQPIRHDRGADTYRTWAATVEGIIAESFFPGLKDARFADPAVIAETTGVEDDEWKDMLAGIHGVKGDTPWTARQILDLINESTLSENQGKPLAYEVLPGELAAKRKPGEPLTRLTKALGWWLTNRAGRWAGEYSVRVHAKDSHGVQWKVVRYVPKG